jgi:polysaccharide export outer membrane protein
MKRLLASLSILIVISSLPSCRYLYPNTMFKQKDYQYFDLAEKEVKQYVIQAGDVFTLRVFARDGFKLIDILGGETSNATAPGASGARNFTYVVDNEGIVRLPVIGYLFVKGYTEVELERILAEKYAGLFVDPWVSVKVNNRRVFVFKGSSSTLVPLEEYPISLIEVIARTGGLDIDAKSFKIKVVRGDIKNPQIYLVDLSTIEGIRKADLSVQPNDIILIERRRHYVTDVLKEISPYLSAVGAISTIIILFKAFGK